MAAHLMQQNSPQNDIYVGISPETNRPMYMLPIDGSLTKQWRDAMRFAAESKGVSQPRLPSDAELNHLFKNSAHIEGGLPDKEFWSSSSSPHKNHKLIVMQNLNTGSRGYFSENKEGSIVLVRG